MGKALEFVLAEPWLILESGLDRIISIAERHGVEDLQALETKLGRPLENTQAVDLRDNGVAVIPVTGPIFRYANLFTRISGATSLQVLARDFAEAEENADVNEIVLAIDSPGGQATGIAEFAQIINQAKKPINAYVDGVGASAAYWIASAADQVVISSTALVGSIGTIATYRPDNSKEIKIVSSQSPLKGATPDTEKGRAEAQRIVDDMTAVFVADVAKYRGVSAEKVMRDFGQGSLLVGAKAVAAGMADSIGSLEALIAGISGTTSMEAYMSEDKTKPGAEVTSEWLKAEHKPIYDAIFAEALASAVIGPEKEQELRSHGAEQERTRIRAVLDQSMPGHEALVQRLAFDGTTTAEQAAVQILAAEKQIRTSARETYLDDAPEPLPSNASATGAKGAQDREAELASLPVEKRCEKLWDESPDIRSEFETVEDYIYFEKAVAGGKVKRLGG